MNINIEPRPKRRGRPPRSEQVPDRSDLLLDAAETLFAQRGFYGVTTREVATVANVDDALIYYHFGSKRGLFDAVLARRAGPLNEARHKSLANYRKTHDNFDVVGALEAFIGPMFDLSTSGEPGWKSYFALVAQIDNTPWGGETIHRFFDGVVHELLDILREALPGSRITELFWAYNFLAGSMMLALSETERIDRLSSGLCQSKDLEAARSRLIDFCAGGIAALVARSIKSSELDCVVN